MLLGVLSLCLPAGRAQALTAPAVTITGGIRTESALTNKTVTMAGRSELHLTDPANPLPGSQIKLNSPDAWLFLENIRPDVVLSDILPKIHINDKAAINGVNVRVAEYDMVRW